MKVLPFKIPKPELDTLVFQEDIGPLFYDKLHQHEDIQLSLIVEGEGTLIVGDSVNNYKENDIIIIGSHLAHLFKSDTKATKNSHMLSLFFTKNSFGKDFFNLTALNGIEPFFKQAENGFKVMSHKDIMCTHFLKLKDATPISRFIILLELLKLTSNANFESLSSFIYDKKLSEIEGKRMEAIFEFTISNFYTDVSLETIAGVANMTKNAFCKYFKKRTNKTYFRFLNELRIENACKLMRQKKGNTIADIAYKSGFKNLSNFNRQFKSIKNMSPSALKNSL
ncbi:AraC family transcriptional regulator [Lacinutrix sp. Bg11-31]|uniref:AraC family transcriptional regulator n=1 Tax=Lacinutrix sp. Bg11-31 TaxID=2057808 RepID=UPI000C30E675|nr:AraC family transcriptional regulator [Lacinutrix sp. Bg11-31]AUC82541.1 AraC family transcriptional regulator [Lacinutrix sp. Bg11-31]